MTPEEQFALEMEKRRAATEAVMRSLQNNANDVHGPSMNPVVADAIANPPAPAPVSSEPSVTPSSVPGQVDVKLGGALKGATIPFTPAPVAETPAVAPAGEKTLVSPSAQPAATASPVSFYRDMILQNDAIRNKEKEDWERREKSDRARTTIAAVTDALASLGNLVGTTQGAFSQTQTYQTPFITEQVERDRALARKRADMLYESDNDIRMAQARYDQQLAKIDRQLAVQDAITKRSLALADLRADRDAALHGYKTDENAQKAQLNKERDAANNEVKMAIAGNRDKTSVTTANIRADATRYSADKRAETSAGGVNGYETEKTYEYTKDEYGNLHKTKETTIRKGSSGTTTTTKETKTDGDKQKKDKPYGKKKEKKKVL